MLNSQAEECTLTVNFAILHSIIFFQPEIFTVYFVESISATVQFDLVVIYQRLLFIGKLYNASTIDNQKSNDASLSRYTDLHSYIFSTLIAVLLKSFS